MRNGMARGFMCAISLAVVTALGATAKADGRMHDGFYMQVTGGLGYYGVSTEPDASISGVTLPGGLMLGGTIIDGLAVGGGLFVDYAPSPGASQMGVDVDLMTAQMLIGLGVFGDYYLNPAEGGLHFQGFVGWGGLEETRGTGGSDPTGLILAAGGGYDMFISDEWSFGVLGRIAYAPLSLNGVSATTIAPAILATLTLH